jgi:hypothetical protein
MSYKKQELLTLYEHLGSHPLILVGSVLLIYLVICVVLLCVFIFWVLCCDIRYDFRIKTMFGSFLPPIGCKRVHVLFMLFVFICTLWCPTYIVLCVCFACLLLVCHILPFSLDCLFLISPSVFSNVFFFKLTFVQV